MTTKFSCTNIYGHQIEVPTPTIDACVAVLKNTAALTDRRELATQILDWASVRRAKKPLTGNTDLDRAAQLMLTEYLAKSLFDGSYRFHKQSINGAVVNVVVDASGEPVPAAA